MADPPDVSTEVRIVLPEPHFTLLDVQRSGQPEVLVVNDALRSFAATDIFPWHLCITLQAEELVENGMPARSESELLFVIGDEIENVVLDGRTGHDSQNALFLARSTWNGIRELSYQVHDPEIAHRALQTLLQSRTWEREWDYRMEIDQAWSRATNLFQLFPRAGGNDA